jgi:hypothetical protein
MAKLAKGDSLKAGQAESGEARLRYDAIRLAQLCELEMLGLLDEQGAAELAALRAKRHDYLRWRAARTEWEMVGQFARPVRFPRIHVPPRREYAPRRLVAGGSPRARRSRPSRAHGPPRLPDEPEPLARRPAT